jgi:hypothetical protein
MTTAPRRGEAVENSDQCSGACWLAKYAPSHRIPSTPPPLNTEPHSSCLAGGAAP